jgi:SAM-dependent methyltransferase
MTVAGEGDAMTSRLYAIDSDVEHERLEAQAALAGIADHLRHVPLRPGARVLDAGCGSGAMARLMAGACPEAAVTGLDRRPAYLAFAADRAEAEGLANVEFVAGDLFALPFADASFDVVWTKYVLQWLAEPTAALAELKRVLRPGGVLVSADFDGFMVEHFPVDPNFDAAAKRLMPQLVDPEIGRKVAGHLLALGFIGVDVVIEHDRVFTVIGAIDGERRRNWEVQWRAARPRCAQILGSEAAADRFFATFFAHHDDPMTATWTSLYVTRATRP